MLLFVIKKELKIATQQITTILQTMAMPQMKITQTMAILQIMGIPQIILQTMGILQTMAQTMAQTMGALKNKAPAIK